MILIASLAPARAELRLTNNIYGRQYYNITQLKSGCIGGVIESNSFFMQSTIHILSLEGQLSSFKTLDLVAVQSSSANLKIASKF